MSSVMANQINGNATSAHFDRFDNSQTPGPKLKNENMKSISKQ